jgi:glycosidase
MPYNFPPVFEFHISRQARDHYKFDQAIFGLSGNVIFANFHAVRLFAQKMNQKRDLIRFPEQAVKAGQINAMGLIDEILHYVGGLYRHQLNPEVFAEAYEFCREQLGEPVVQAALARFAEQFPPSGVYQRELSLEAYLSGETGGIPNQQILLEELLLLWLANKNPAFSPFLELFDDTELERETGYTRLIASLHEFFGTQPGFGPEVQNLIDMLRSPAIAVPYSLTGQLEYIRERWGFLLGQYLFRLLSSLDLIQEEDKAIFFGPGQARVYDFSGMETEAERFSPDRDWMPSLVLIAKNAYVWMDQLSKEYKRPINRLDQIPDEELEKLARWGISGLWLIGLWERSAASQRIKQLRGNPDAVASAYSLYEYQIAADIGGEDAYLDLRQRAWDRGLRLASDMVPNHVGIDSRWVIQHPDWFISLDYSPFPSYSFNGPDLSWDERVGIFLEDHYYDNSDAAVVFLRLDRWTGSMKFIYHGNDGTSMPWNDTAQLNYLLPEVREAVIQTILHVARKFSIIRFDAAMTLAKKHFQRLWFPEPGTGGAIPTRAEQGLTKEQFDAAFPVEFWRELVDRVAQEVPDTLLLAEAFWLMEGYFVRTLGMHRVYNSAFMNMLRDEKNLEYRLVIKNTLEFDPEILKRYVNFMNNPDERTAVDQFGKGDKYFGVCTLLATMPGLPMFGHGQVEGYIEKYGMEFRRAYWDETPDRWLVERHEREIFPLLRRRRQFAEVTDFLLYDFYSTDGGVNEDVFAYSNKRDDDRSLIVYHNRFAEARGWIRSSAAYSVKAGEQQERRLIQKNLWDGLGLRNEADWYTIFRDQVSGLEYIRENRQVHQQGMYFELGAYKYQVFLDFRQVRDNEWHHYAQLNAYLQGRGVPSIDDTLKEIFLQPVLSAFREVVNPEIFRRVSEQRIFDPVSLNDPVILNEIKQKYLHLLVEINRHTGTNQDEQALQSIAGDVINQVKSINVFLSPEQRTPSKKDQDYNQAMEFARGRDKDEPGGALHHSSVLLGWAFTHALGRVTGENQAAETSRAWLDEWLLGKILAGTFRDIGMDEGLAWWSVQVVSALVSHQAWPRQAVEQELSSYQMLRSWLQDGDVQRLIQVNRYQGILWFNHESFEQLLEWMMRMAVVSGPAGEDEEVAESRIAASYRLIQEIQQAESNSGYQVEKLLEAAEPELSRR